MGNDLRTFHEKCKFEYTELLKHFNIMFYGYGNKEPLLKCMFPNALRFNMRFSTLRSITEDLILQGYGNKINSTIKDIDRWLKLKKTKILLILFNFDFECHDLENLTNIRLIGTIENLDTSFEMKCFEAYNFILRDLTTFEDYDEDIIDMELSSNTVLNVTMILKNLSPKSRLAFIELLKIGNCEIENFFNNVKKPLFLTKTSTLLDLLREFVDHKVIKIQENKIRVLLSNDEKKKILDTVSNSQ